MWHPVAFTSRRLRQQEGKYETMKRKTLAVVHTLHVWKLYFFRPFELMTDNQGVAYLKSKPEISKSEARWVEFLAESDFTVQHRPGKENMADSLYASLRTPANASVTMEQAEQVTDIQQRVDKGYQLDKSMRRIIESLGTDRNDAIKRRYVRLESDNRMTCT